MRKDDFFQRVGVMALTVALGLGACGPDPASPRGAAERFLDAYFGLDRETAAQASAGPARALVDEERRLTAGQPVDAATRFPTISYRLLQERAGEDTTTVHLVYAVRIAVPDAESSEQRWLVTIGRVKADWKVVNFTRVPG